jgi:uncharacterized protein
MEKYLKPVSSLFFGLFLLALGIVMSINANLGLGPWNAFHLGISNHTRLSFGQTQMVVGISIILLSLFMGIRPGWGTVANMTFVGIFVDLINSINIIPKCNSFITGLLMLIISLFVTGFGSYFYMSAGLGIGPRDSLMIVLGKKIPWPIGAVRNSIEVIVLLIGLLLGAPLGSGTIIYTFGIGYVMQSVFKLFSFDAKTIVHREITEVKNSENL